MRTVVLAAMGLALAAAAIGSVVFGDDGPQPEPWHDVESTTLPPERDSAWMFNPANPVNQPFSGDFSTSLDEHRAVKAVQDLAFAGAQTTVVSVERMRYGQAICGLSKFGTPDIDVYLVVFQGPFRAVVGSHGFSATPYDLPSKAYIVDAAAFHSLQSFAPWPLERDPNANCPAD